MREIKFRAWDGIRMTTSGIMFNTSLGIVETAANMPLTQYTGLKDSKGKEIYEGDIIHCKYGKKGGQHLLVKEISEHGLFFTSAILGHCYFYTNLPQRETMEVIGNIYENPELIKV